LLTVDFRIGLDAAGRPFTANEQLRVNLRELMEWRRMTQADLAEMLSVSQPWVSKRMSGTTPFQMSDVDMLAHAFGVSPAELLCGGWGKFDRRRQGSERRSGQDRRGPQPRKPVL
jgi:transcriptional regulator with XRE-family HTH domain